MERHSSLTSLALGRVDVEHILGYLKHLFQRLQWLGCASRCGLWAVEQRRILSSLPDISARNVLGTTCIVQGMHQVQPFSPVFARIIAVITNIHLSGVRYATMITPAIPPTAFLHVGSTQLPPASGHTVAVKGPEQEVDACEKEEHVCQQNPRRPPVPSSLFTRSPMPSTLLAAAAVEAPTDVSHVESHHASP